MYKHIKRICVTALLVALAVVFGRLFTIKISLGGAYAVNFGLGTLPILLLCVIYGPVYGMLGSALWDLIGALLLPAGSFVPWFTLAAAVYGFIAGAFFCKLKINSIYDAQKGYGTVLTFYHSASEPTVLRILLATFAAHLVYSVGLNTFLIHTLYSVPYKVLLIPRLIDNAAMIPLNTILLVSLVKILRTTNLLPERFNRDAKNTAKRRKKQKLYQSKSQWRKAHNK